MSDFHLLIRGASDIGVVDGRIAALGENLSGSADEEIDATELRIFPGVIDAHVHFNEPGRTEWEGFATGTRAAAAGGTTTVFDMPLNAHPPTIDGPSFDEKLAAASASSVVDFALWGGLVPGNVDHFETLRDRGVVGLKAFMSNSGIDDFQSVDLPTLRVGMKRATELGMIVAVHAESDELTTELAREKIAQGRTSIRDYLDSRPVGAELEAIRAAIDIANETGCALHVVHVSSAAGVELIAEARARGVDVTCETCPHYLVLTEGDMERLGAVAKCAPPLRSASEQRALRDQLVNITTIGSDHSPSPTSMKTDANFFKVWGGISGCQHLLPLLLDLPHDLVARLTSANVASRFRLPQKGRVALGVDADFALVEMREEEIEMKNLLYRHQQSPYVGRHTHGRVVRTILRGQTIFQDGKFAGRGTFVRPAS